MSNILEPVYKVVDIHKEFDRELYRTLCMASATASYSMCIEYMEKWFLSKFKKDYFKSVYIDRKHVLDDAMTMSEIQKIKRMKPALAIVPTIDFSFDNEKLDAKPFGLTCYCPRGGYNDSFFKDPTNNSYLGINLGLILMNFNFKIKVATRAAQLDLYKFMKLAFRVGFTQGEYVDMDMHVPYELMLQLARDTGFYIKNEKISDITKFLNYLNSHSTIPFMYKYRCVNGKSEFFIRMTGVYVHISTPELSADDGETEGHLNTNYIIEMQSTVRFPTPQFFAYYGESGKTEFTNSGKYDDSNSLNCFSLRYLEIAETNEKGWPQYLTTEYEEEDRSKPLSIEFNELFAAGTDLRRVIDYTISLGLSPNIFMEIKIFNNGDLIPTGDMNWDTFVYNAGVIMLEERSFIVLYTDLKYINETILTLDGAKESRIN